MLPATHVARDWPECRRPRHPNHSWSRGDFGRRRQAKNSEQAHRPPLSGSGLWFGQSRFNRSVSICLTKNYFLSSVVTVGIMT